MLRHSADGWVDVVFDSRGGAGCPTAKPVASSPGNLDGFCGRRAAGAERITQVGEPGRSHDVVVV